MFNRVNIQMIANYIFDIISIISILVIVIILFTGGYKGDVCGVFINIRRLEIPIFVLLSSIVTRYIISKEDIVLTRPVQILINIRSYMLEKPKRTFFIITSYLIFFKLLQHFTYQTYACDLSVFDYPLHFTLKGNFMYFPWWGTIKNFLGMHFWPILIAIVPFYVIYDSPIMLLILQGLFTSLALIPVLQIAKYNGFDSEDRLYIGIFYIFNLFVWRAFRYNFHIEILYPLFLFSAFYTILKKRYILHTVFIILSLSVKEDAFLHCVMLESFILIFTNNRRIAFFNIMLSLLWGFIVLKVALPYLREGDSINVFINERYGHLGSSLTEIILYIISHPIEIFKMVFRESLFRFLLSFGFLPLLYPKLALFGLPSIFIHLITNFPAQYKLHFYHSLPAIPFFVISTIYALKGFNMKWRKILLILLMIISFLGFRSSGFLIPNLADIRAHRYFSNFPIDKRISAQANIVPHLPRIVTLSVFPDGSKNAEYILLKLDQWHAGTGMTTLEYYNMIIKLLDMGYFSVEKYFPPYLILKRGISSIKTNDKTSEIREDILELIKKWDKKQRGAY